MTVSRSSSCRPRGGRRAYGAGQTSKVSGSRRKSLGSADRNRGSRSVRDDYSATIEAKSISTDLRGWQGEKSGDGGGRFDGGRWLGGEGAGSLAVGGGMFESTAERLLRETAPVENKAETCKSRLVWLIVVAGGMHRRSDSSALGEAFIVGGQVWAAGWMDGWHELLPGCGWWCGGGGCGALEKEERRGKEGRGPRFLQRRVGSCYPHISAPSYPDGVGSS